MLIRRLDHPIVCVRDRKPWVSMMEDIFALQPLHSREGDEWGFSNAEIAVGDGLLGIVEPTGPESQLSQFINQFGEGFYAMSVDVGDIKAAAAHFETNDIPYREAHRNGEVTLLWLPPKATGGVLYQISPGMAIEQGTNSLYQGINDFVVAVTDLNKSITTYKKLFDLPDPEIIEKTHQGSREAVFTIKQHPVTETLTLATPSSSDSELSNHIESRGEGIFQFTIAVTNLTEELERLNALEKPVPYTIEKGANGPLSIRIGPKILNGIRIELRQI